MLSQVEEKTIDNSARNKPSFTFPERSVVPSQLSSMLSRQTSHPSVPNLTALSGNSPSASHRTVVSTSLLHDSDECSDIYEAPARLSYSPQRSITNKWEAESTTSNTQDTVVEEYTSGRSSEEESLQSTRPRAGTLPENVLGNYCKLVDSTYFSHKSDWIVTTDLPQLVQKANLGLKCGIVPELADGALGGTYFLRGCDNRISVVFKPCDQEPHSFNNPYEQQQQQQSQSLSLLPPATQSRQPSYESDTAAGPLKPLLPISSGNGSTCSGTSGSVLTYKVGNIVPGFGMYREIAAYVLDNGFAGVPPTSLARVQHPLFGDATINSHNSSMCEPSATVEKQYSGDDNNGNSGLVDLSTSSSLPIDITTTSRTTSFNTTASHSQNTVLTTLESMGSSSTRSDNTINYYNTTAAPIGYPGTASATLGAIQSFVPSECSAEDMGYCKFSVNDILRIAIFDMRLCNLDRHEGNILVVRQNATPNYQCYPHTYCVHSGRIQYNKCYGNAMRGDKGDGSKLTGSNSSNSLCGSAPAVLHIERYTTTLTNNTGDDNNNDNIKNIEKCKQSKSLDVPDGSISNDNNNKNNKNNRLQECYRLIPIDHGYCLPHILSIREASFAWLHWLQVKVPVVNDDNNDNAATTMNDNSFAMELPDELLQYIEQLDYYDDMRLLQKTLGSAIPWTSLLTLFVCTMLLKIGVLEYHLRLYDIAQLFVAVDMTENSKEMSVFYETVFTNMLYHGLNIDEDGIKQLQRDTCSTGGAGGVHSGRVTTANSNNVSLGSSPGPISRGTSGNTGCGIASTSVGGDGSGATNTRNNSPLNHYIKAITCPLQTLVNITIQRILLRQYISCTLLGPPLGVCKTSTSSTLMANNSLPLTEEEPNTESEEKVKNNETIDSSDNGTSAKGGSTMNGVSATDATDPAASSFNTALTDVNHDSGTTGGNNTVTTGIATTDVANTNASGCGSNAGPAVHNNATPPTASNSIFSTFTNLFRSTSSAVLGTDNNNNNSPANSSNNNANATNTYSKQRTTPPAATNNNDYISRSSLVINDIPHSCTSSAKTTYDAKVPYNDSPVMKPATLSKLSNKSVSSCKTMIAATPLPLSRQQSYQATSLMVNPRTLKRVYQLDNGGLLHDELIISIHLLCKELATYSQELQQQQQQEQLQQQLTHSPNSGRRIVKSAEILKYY